MKSSSVSVIVEVEHYGGELLFSGETIADLSETAVSLLVFQNVKSATTAEFVDLYVLRVCSSEAFREIVLAHVLISKNHKINILQPSNSLIIAKYH